MKNMLTPDEKAKKILEQERQEKLLLQRQAEEEEQEEEDRRRRLKERTVIAFLTYMKLQEDEKLSGQDQMQYLRELRADYFCRHTEQTYLFNRMMLESLAQHETNTARFLFAGESREQMEKHRMHMESAGLDASEYQALAVADLCKDKDSIEDVELTFRGEEPSERLTLQRRESLTHADEALAAYSKGDIRKLEKTLKEGLLTACHAFSHTGDTLNAVHWSKQINGVLSIVSSHPVLFKNGADSPLLEAATGMAALGRVMENGLKALNELCTAQMNRKPLSPEKEMNLQAQVLLMQQSDLQRANEQYRKLFSKGYHPKKGLNREKMEKMLKELQGSQAMYTLSVMKPERRMFTLTDPESRCILCERLFAPHTEKAPVVTERERKIEAPCLRKQ